jgi:hypothetical protein
MANQRNPNDPYRSADDPYRSPDRSAADPNRLNPAGDDFNRAVRLDTELQPDPELAEGPATGGRIVMAAIAIAVVLGAVFYGLNNSSSINQAGTSATTQTAQTQSSPPAAPPGMRDVTPKPNAQPGMTTGATPARPQGAPSSAPTGQEVNQSGGTPANPAPNSNDTK